MATVILYYRERLAVFNQWMVGCVLCLAIRNLLNEFDGADSKTIDRLVNDLVELDDMGNGVFDFDPAQFLSTSGIPETSIKFGLSKLADWLQEYDRQIPSSELAKLGLPKRYIFDLDTAIALETTKALLELYK